MALSVETRELFVDALEQPHLLIGGMTGSGKSVFINGLMRRIAVDSPKEKQCILIDPKAIELLQWSRLPHCIGYASQKDDIARFLKIARDTMFQRTREAQEYNRNAELFGKLPLEIPDLYIVVDEFASLTSRETRAAKQYTNEILEYLTQIVQTGRTSKIHLILATQSANVTVIPSVLRNNIDARLAFHARDANASRVILGFRGAEKLPLYGQALYYRAGLIHPELVNIPLYPDSELIRVIKFWETRMTRAARNKRKQWR